MARIDITALDRELRQGKVSPIYAIVGDEPYLASGALKMVKEALGADGDDAFNVSSFSARDADPERVIDALRTVPMMGGRPTVLLRDGEELAKAARKKLLDAVTAYAESPLDSASLVITATKIDGRLKLMQLVAKAGSVVECKKLYDDKLPSWIGMEVKRKGRQISFEAAKFLSEMVGNDLGQIAGSIERLVLYVGDRKLIELKDVEEAVTETHQRDIFELTDAVGQRKLPRALSYLHNLVENGQPAPLILHMLARHFRILSKAREVEGRMSDKSEIARYLGVNPFYVGNYVSQARNFSKQELRRSFNALHRCDRAIKSSRLPKERVLERAIISITEE